KHQFTRKRSKKIHACDYSSRAARHLAGARHLLNRRRDSSVDRGPWMSKRRWRMEFGMFHEFPSLPGRSESEAFDEAMEQVDAAERLGLDVMWLAELHFEPRRSVLSAPLSIASAIAGRTRRIKIGIAVQVLPLCHPLRLAEEAATVD